MKQIMADGSNLKVSEGDELDRSPRWTMHMQQRMANFRNSDTSSSNIDKS